LVTENVTFNQTLTNALYASASAGNASWNQSMANLIYASLALVNGNNSAWLSTFNATYAAASGNASFNQTLSDNLYADRSIIKVQRRDIASVSILVYNATSLNFPVKSGRNYTINCNLLYTGAAATTGMRVNFTSTALTADVTLSYNTWSSATASVGFSATSFTNLTGTGSGAGVIKLHKLIADFRTTAAGNVNLTIASEVATSASTLKRGSMCELFDITEYNV
ncbi:MAG: hypothetical protein AABW84_02755, partial [Nanoarchaeota archaeon]